MTICETSTQQYFVRPGVAEADLEDGNMELAFEDHKLKLSSVGTQIWKGFREGRSEAEVVDTLAALYAVDRDRLQEDVQRFAGMLADNLVLMREKTVAESSEAGITFQELLDADGPNVPGALPDALGDRHLCSHNSIFAAIRRKALALGYRYESGSDDPLWIDYGVFSLSCLDRIISQRVVPYFQNRAALERLAARQPARRVPLRFLRSNLKSNYVLHESSHGVAHEIVAAHPYRLEGSADSATISAIVNALMEEAFANTVERLASMEAQSLLHHSFFAWNSYMAADTADRAVLEKAHQRIGEKLTFFLLFFGHVLANLYPQEPPEELTLGLVDRVGTANTATARNLVRMALNLNVAFRAETNPSYFQMLGMRKEYEKLCVLPVDAYLDLIDVLKPWASQLRAVLTPDNAVAENLSKSWSASRSAGAVLAAALKQRAQMSAHGIAPAISKPEVRSWLAAFDQLGGEDGSAIHPPSSPSSVANYLTLRSLVPQPLLGMLHGHALARARGGSMVTDDPQVPKTPSAYGDPVMEELLLRLLPAIESASGYKLFPTYSYFRVYKQGDVLKRHLDRPPCEISVTLSLGYEAESAWPICVKTGETQSQISLEPGDALVYRGTEVEHWRDKFEGNRSAQVFLHYVRQDGPNAAWRFDKRAALCCLSAVSDLREKIPA